MRYLFSATSGECASWGQAGGGGDVPEVPDVDAVLLQQGADTICEVSLGEGGGDAELSSP